MAYELKGTFLDFCSCGEQCYCQPQGARDSSDCQAVNAWHIDSGAVGDTDVSGLTLVGLSQVHGHVIAGRSIAYYVNEEATDAQRAALWDAWSGTLGGPLADMVHLTGELRGIEPAPVTYRFAARGDTPRITLQVEGVFSAQVERTAATGAADRGPYSGGDICTATPAAPGGLGESASRPTSASDQPSAAYMASASGAGMNMDLRDTRAAHGHFHFEG
jgi:hypothetical protein